jgi:hypothetical protein
MTTTKDVDTVLASQDLPLELCRLSGTHQGQEGRMTPVLSGVIAARQQDEVICPYMLRRNLLVPAHQGSVAQSAWRVR